MNLAKRCSDSLNLAATKKIPLGIQSDMVFLLISTVSTPARKEQQVISFI